MHLCVCVASKPFTLRVGREWLGWVGCPRPQRPLSRSVTCQEPTVWFPPEWVAASPGPQGAFVALQVLPWGPGRVAVEPPRSCDPDPGGLGPWEPVPPALGHSLAPPLPTRSSRPLGRAVGPSGPGRAGCRGHLCAPAPCLRWGSGASGLPSLGEGLVLLRAWTSGLPQSPVPRGSVCSAYAPSSQLSQRGLAQPRPVLLTIAPPSLPLVHFQHESQVPRHEPASP